MSILEKQKKNFISCIIFLILFLNSIPNISNAEIIKKIEISGNDRISKETVILFSELKLNEDIDTTDLNNAIKKLYETSFFDNISIDFTNNILSISVVENPLIQKLQIDGIKKNSLIENIKEIIVQKEKSSFVESKIKEDQNRILNALKVNGYYFSDVKINIKRNDNNTVDIIYDINLGEKV